MRGTGRLENDLYVMNANCLLDKYPGVHLKSPSAVAHTASTQSFNVACLFGIRD